MDNTAIYISSRVLLNPSIYAFKYALVNGKPKKNFSVAILEYIITEKKYKTISKPYIDWDNVDGHIHSIEELTKEEYEEYIKGIAKSKKEV